MFFYFVAINVFLESAVKVLPFSKAEDFIFTDSVVPARRCCHCFKALFPVCSCSLHFPFVWQPLSLGKQCVIAYQKRQYILDTTNIC